MRKISGLKIPIIYNTNGFENVETIKALDGYIDVYLPDLKYYSNELSKKYSKVDNYFEVATKAITEMYNQVGTAKFNSDGIIQRGVIIRHLVLPNHLQNSKHILKWIKDNMPNDIYVSVMAQYFPTYRAKQDEYINRKLNLKEYKEIENFLFTLGLENGYMQDLGKHEEEYVQFDACGRSDRRRRQACRGKRHQPLQYDQSDFGRISVSYNAGKARTEYF